MITSVHFCTHDKSYESHDTVCMDPWQYPGIIIGGQDTSLIKCSDNDDSIEYNRWIGESVCDYGCAAKEFGKNCESCSAYMTRVGEQLPADSIWDDFSDYN